MSRKNDEGGLLVSLEKTTDRERLNVSLGSQGLRQFMSSLLAFPIICHPTLAQGPAAS
jgi:hypothetical protein